MVNDKVPTPILTVTVTQEGNSVATSINGTVDPATAAGHLLRAVIEILTNKPAQEQSKVFPQLRPKRF